MKRIQKKNKFINIILGLLVIALAVMFFLPPYSSRENKLEINNDKNQFTVDAPPENSGTPPSSQKTIQENTESVINREESDREPSGRIGNTSNHQPTRKRTRGDTIDPDVFIEQFDEIIQIPNVSDRQAALVELGGNLVFRDMGLALEFMDKISIFDDQYVYVNNIIQTLMEAEKREQAIEFFDEIEDTRLRASVVKAIAVPWLQEDLGAALEWIQSLQPDLLRDIAAITAQKWAVVDFDAAAEWAATIKDRKIRDKSMLSLSAELSKTDPKSAALWAQNFSPGMNRSKALYRSAHYWAYKDAKGAAEWAATLDDTRDKSKILNNIIRIWATKKPFDAASWAETMPDATLQQTLLETVAKQWMFVDPTEGRAWIRNSSLPEQKIKDLLKE